MISEKLANAILKILPWILAAVPLLRVINPQSSQLSMMSVELMVLSAFLLLIAVLIRKERLSISMSLVAFLLVCAFSILNNYIIDEYQPWRRLIFFLIFLCCYGPLFISETLDRLRRKTLKLICIAFTAISLFAMIAYTTKLAVSGYVEAFWPFSKFNVMVMAGVCAVSIIYLFYRIFDVACRNKIRLVCYSVALVILVAMLVVAASRVAMAGVAFALIVSIVAGVLFGKKRILTVKNIVGVVIALLMATAMVVPFTELMEKKVEYSESHGSYLSSRANRWENRIREFKESPIIGVGFSSYRYRNTALNPFDDVSTIGRIEPGSSWLFLLSSLGVVGFAAFALIFIKRVYDNVKYYTNYSLLLLTLLAFLAIHMTAEGYVVAAGSPICPVLWLALTKRKNVVS